MQVVSSSQMSLDKYSRLFLPGMHAYAEADEECMAQMHPNDLLEGQWTTRRIKYKLRKYKPGVVWSAIYKQDKTIERLWRREGLDKTVPSTDNLRKRGWKGYLTSAT